MVKLQCGQKKVKSPLAEVYLLLLIHKPFRIAERIPLQFPVTSLGDDLQPVVNSAST